ncbi:dnaJ protein homolog 1 [Drosophila eugracilis]|uniref:dnaJ protein homolog 1 n=1 Tax=Drosophila eugracilis TaxID=29029 RepID=UPI0007E71F1F|nr:dnaJ protein homolog 1 [Drosophila eugracilis]
MAKDFYNILGISRGANDEEIRKAYRKQALRYHPDKNKDAESEERFKEVAEAYEVLSDKKKRDIYDSQGEEGLRRGVPYQRRKPNGGMESRDFSYQFHGDARATFAQFFGSSDPFSMFFDDLETGADGAFGAAGLHRGRLQKDPPIEHNLEVALEDIANGCLKRIKISRLSLSSNGSQIREDKFLNIDIRPGWKAGTKIIFSEEGDQLPNRVPADIVFVIRDKPHPIFRRDGSDLLYTAHISLKEALCGTTLVVKTLKGKSLELSTKGEVLEPNSTRRFPGYGLPWPKNNSRRGDIIVSFDIKFPDTIPKKLTSLLANLLPI